MQINDIINKLSKQGLINVLSEHSHITLNAFGEDDLNDLKQISQHNLNDDLIDEFDFLNELSGEIDLNEI